MALAAGVAIVLFVAHVESYGFATTGCVATAGLVLVPGFGLACVVLGAARGRSRLVGRGIALVLAAVLALFAAGFVVRTQERASEKRGNELCRALEACRQATGAYPATLHELVPRFLAAVPSSCMSLFRDFPFRYQRQQDGLDYLLGFDSTGFMVRRRGADGRWWSDD